MSTTEDRLRAAAEAAASTVLPGSAPPLRLPAETARYRTQPRPGWRRGVNPLAAAASVLGVLAASLAIAHGAQSSHAAPAARAHHGGPAVIPPYYVALTSGATRHPGNSPQYALVRATATGKVLAKITAPAPYRTFEAVTGARDDRTFVLTAGHWNVTHRGGGAFIQDRPLKFFLLRLGRSGAGSHLTPLAIPVGGASAIALSPDGSQLAEAVNHERQDRMMDPSVRVVTLSTGAERTWTWPGSAWITSNDAVNQQLLSWSGDGRTIAYEQWLKDDEQVRMLDTKAPGSDLRASKLVLDFRGQAYTTWRFHHGRVTDALSGYNALLTPDGTKIIAGTDTVIGRPGRVTSDDPHFTEFSARTGAVLRELHPAGRVTGDGQSQDVQWVSPTGSAFIGSVLEPGATHPSDRSVIGVARGGHFTPLPGAWSGIIGVAW